MRRWLPVFLAPLALVALQACQSQVPLASTYDLTFQQKMQAAAHWQVLARDIVEQVSLRTSVYDRDIVIEREGGDTDFSTAFDDMLVTEFVERGYVVREVAGPDSLVLRYKTQVITHQSRGYVRPPPGTFTVLTAGVLAVREVLLDNWASGEAIAALGVAAVGADIVAGSITETTNTEFIVTTSVLRNETYLARYTDIYYLPEGDVGLYESRGAVDPDAPFTIAYDSWVRSLSDVRAEASARCESNGMWTMLLGRNASQRMQTAEFRCYVP